MANPRSIGRLASSGEEEEVSIMNHMTMGGIHYYLIWYLPPTTRRKLQKLLASSQNTKECLNRHGTTSIIEQLIHLYSVIDNREME